MLAALAAAGYAGKVFPVNPNQTEINDLAWHASIGAIPDEIVDVRGRPPADIDINPQVVRAEGQGAVAVDALLVARG